MRVKDLKHGKYVKGSMAATGRVTPRWGTYEWLLGHLNGKLYRTLTNNTTVELWPSSGHLQVKLHDHTVMDYAPDGLVHLYSRGWRTVTTKERLNALLPANVAVYQEDYEWYVRAANGTRKFYEGITVDVATGNIVSTQDA